VVMQALADARFLCGMACGTTVWCVEALVWCVAGAQGQMPLSLDEVKTFP
jgi:hypothetical protein